MLPPHGRDPSGRSSLGAGLVQYLDVTAKKSGIEVYYDTRAATLIYDGERVLGGGWIDRGLTTPNVVNAAS